MEGEFIITTPLQLKALLTEVLSNALLAKQPSVVPQLDTDKWMTIQELSDYLPGKPAVTTLYGKVQRQEIPHNRMGKKRLTFRKSEIDAWLKAKRCKTQSEIALEADKYLSAQKSGRR